MLPLNARWSGRKVDRDELVRRLQALTERYPRFEPGLVARIVALRDSDRMAEAEDFAQQVLARMPDSARMAIEHARLALHRSDWEAAASRFRSVRDRFPQQLDGYTGLAEALSRQERYDEAETVLHVAMAKFPFRTIVAIEYAMIASRRNDCRLALARLMEARARFPHDPGIGTRIFEIQLRVAELDDDAGAPTIARVPAEARMGPETREQPMREVMLEFESLGGRALGCEFGLLQRRYGAEPLGLLRWTEISPDGLIAALEAEFQGVGLPENTEIRVDSRFEYGCIDRLYQMRMHTFVSRDSSPAELMHVQMCRRLQFLARKLIDDLREGKKVFVYRVTARNLTDDELDRLHVAMRRYGENTLLYVRYEDANHRNGTVEYVKPGLMIGYIDRFAVGPDSKSLVAATESWTAICLRANALWRAQRAGCH